MLPPATVHWESAQPTRVLAQTRAITGRPGWQELGTAPLAANAAYAVSAWTGSELLLWGGQRLRDCTRTVSGGTERPVFQSPGLCDHAPQEGLLDGVILDTVKNEWRVIPPAPLDRPLLYPAGVWDGHELIITGQSCWAPTAPDTCFPGGFPVVAYDPQRNRWATLPSPRSAYRGHDTEYARAAGWTGRLALFNFRGALLGYDPAANEWSTMLATERSGNVCTSQHRIVALGSDHTERGPLHFVVRTDTKNSRWISSPKFVTTGPAPSRPLRCTARGAVFLQSDRRAFVLDAATMTATALAPPGVHGDWYGGSRKFAPMALDNNREIELPSTTTTVFDAGSEVVAVVNRANTCTRGPCPTDERDGVEVLLRR